MRARRTTAGSSWATASAGRKRCAQARSRLAVGDITSAERALQDALLLVGRDRGSENAPILHLLGEASFARGDLAAADAYFREVLAVGVQSGAHLETRCLIALARIALRRGERDVAASAIFRADATVASDCARCVAQLSLVAAEVALARGDIGQARERCSRGLEPALREQLTAELAALRRVAERFSSPV